jgi:hypothetical protein
MLFLGGCQNPPQTSASHSPPVAVHTRIYAEYAGQIEKIMIAPGQAVKPGDELFEIKEIKSKTRLQPIPEGRMSSELDRLSETVFNGLRFSDRIQKKYGQDQMTEAYLMTLEVIVHNLGNINTTGFKRCRVHFEELLNQVTLPHGSGHGAGEPAPAWLEGCEGCGSQAIYFRVFTTGELIQTGEPLDLAIRAMDCWKCKWRTELCLYTRWSLEIAADAASMLQAGS